VRLRWFKARICDLEESFDFGLGLGFGLWLVVVAGLDELDVGGVNIDDCGMDEVEARSRPKVLRLLSSIG
jgi:hypothetical protein